MDLLSVRDAIATGRFDSCLDDIKSAIRERQTVLNARQARQFGASLNVGDRITIKLDAPIRPRYLLGTPMIVKRINQTTATVAAENPAALPSARYAHGIRVPLAHCELIA